MRAGEKLIKAVRKVHGEEFGYIKGMEMFDVNSKKKYERKKEKRSRKTSEQTSVHVSPVRRKDSVGRKNK